MNEEEEEEEEEEDVRKKRTLKKLTKSEIYDAAKLKDDQLRDVSKQLKQRTRELDDAVALSNELKRKVHFLEEDLRLNDERLAHVESNMNLIKELVKKLTY